MALTLNQLEQAYNSMAVRIANIERKLDNVISVAQLNGIILVVQKDIEDIKQSVETLQNETDTLTTRVDEIV